MRKPPEVTGSFIAKNGFTIEYAPEAGADVQMTQEQLDKASFAKATDVLPPAFFEAVEEFRSSRRLGRPPLEETKEATNIRYDKKLLSAFRATGRGWQTRMNDALRGWLKLHFLA